jgi:hypothetical protein
MIMQPVQDLALVSEQVRTWVSTTMESSKVIINTIYNCAFVSSAVWVPDNSFDFTGMTLLGRIVESSLLTDSKCDVWPFV